MYLFVVSDFKTYFSYHSNQSLASINFRTTRQSYWLVESWNLLALYYSDQWGCIHFSTKIHCDCILIPLKFRLELFYLEMYSPYQSRQPLTSVHIYTMWKSVSRLFMWFTCVTVNIKLALILFWGNIEQTFKSVCTNKWQSLSLNFSCITMQCNNV